MPSEHLPSTHPGRFSLTVLQPAKESPCLHSADHIIKIIILSKLQLTIKPKPSLLGSKLLVGTDFYHVRHGLHFLLHVLCPPPSVCFTQPTNPLSNSTQHSSQGFPNPHEDQAEEEVMLRRGLGHLETEPALGAKVPMKPNCHY